MGLPIALQLTAMATSSWQQHSSVFRVLPKTISMLCDSLTRVHAQTLQASKHQAAEVDTWQLYKLLCCLLPLNLGATSATADASMCSNGTQEHMLPAPVAGSAGSQLAPCL
jgi:hypothetical protein